MQEITETGTYETMTRDQYHERVRSIDVACANRYRDQIDEAYDAGTTVNDIVVRTRYWAACAKADRNV